MRKAKIQAREERKEFVRKHVAILKATMPAAQAKQHLVEKPLNRRLTGLGGCQQLSENSRGDGELGGRQQEQSQASSQQPLASQGLSESHHYRGETTTTQQQQQQEQFQASNQPFVSQGVSESHQYRGETTTTQQQQQQQQQEQFQASSSPFVSQGVSESHQYRGETTTTQQQQQFQASSQPLGSQGLSQSCHHREGTATQQQQQQGQPSRASGQQPPRVSGQQTPRDPYLKSPKQVQWLIQPPFHLTLEDSQHPEHKCCQQRDGSEFANAQLKPMLPMDVIFQYMDKPNQPLLPLEIAPLMPYSDPLITDAVWQYRKGHIERKQQASEVQEMPQPVAMRDWWQAYPQHTQAFATTQKAWAAHSSNAESVTNKPVTSERRDSQSIREPRLIRLEGDHRESQQTRDPRQPFPLRDAPILSDLRTRWATQSSRPQPPRSQPSQAQSLQTQPSQAQPSQAQSLQTQSLQTQSSRPQPPGSQPLQAQPPEQQTLLAAIQMPYNTETSCPLCLVQIDTPESDRAQQGDAGLTPPQLETEDLLMALKGEESPNMMAYMQYYQRKYPNTRFWNPDLTAGQRDLTIVHLTVREHQRDRFLRITDVLRRAFPLLTPPNLTENQRAMLRIQLESLARRIYLLFLFPMLVPLCSAIAKYHLRTAQTKSREFAQKVKRVYAELGKSVLSVPLIDTKYIFTEQVRQEAASEPEAIPGEVPTVLTFDSQQQAVAIEDVAPNMDMQVPVCHHYRSSVVPAVGKEREASPTRTGPAQYPPPGMPMHYPIQQPTQSSSRRRRRRRQLSRSLFPKQPMLLRTIEAPVTPLPHVQEDEVQTGLVEPLTRAETHAKVAETLESPTGVFQAAEAHAEAMETLESTPGVLPTAETDVKAAETPGSPAEMFQSATTQVEPLKRHECPADVFQSATAHVEPLKRQECPAEVFQKGTAQTEPLENQESPVKMFQTTTTHTGALENHERPTEPSESHERSTEPLESHERSTEPLESQERPTEPTEPPESQESPTELLESQERPTEPLESQERPTEPLESQESPTEPLESQESPTESLPKAKTQTEPRKSTELQAESLQAVETQVEPLKRTELLADSQTELLLTRAPLSEFLQTVETQTEATETTAKMRAGSVEPLTNLSQKMITASASNDASAFVPGTESPQVKTAVTLVQTPPAVSPEASTTTRRRRRRDGNTTVEQHLKMAKTVATQDVSSSDNASLRVDDKQAAPPATQQQQSTQSCGTEVSLRSQARPMVFRSKLWRPPCVSLESTTSSSAERVLTEAQQVVETTQEKAPRSRMTRESSPSMKSARNLVALPPAAKLAKLAAPDNKGQREQRRQQSHLSPRLLHQSQLLRAPRIGPQSAARSFEQSDQVHSQSEPVHRRSSAIVAHHPEPAHQQQPFQEQCPPPASQRPDPALAMVSPAVAKSPMVHAWPQTLACSTATAADPHASMAASYIVPQPSSSVLLQPSTAWSHVLPPLQTAGLPFLQEQSPLQAPLQAATTGMPPLLQQSLPVPLQAGIPLAAPVTQHQPLPVCMQATMPPLSKQPPLRVEVPTNASAQAAMSSLSKQPLLRMEVSARLPARTAMPSLSKQSVLRVEVPTRLKTQTKVPPLLKQPLPAHTHVAVPPALQDQQLAGMPSALQEQQRLPAEMLPPPLSKRPLPAHMQVEVPPTLQEQQRLPAEMASPLESCLQVEVSPTLQEQQLRPSVPTDLSDIRKCHGEMVDSLAQLRAKPVSVSAEQELPSRISHSIHNLQTSIVARQHLLHVKQHLAAATPTTALPDQATSRQKPQTHSYLPGRPSIRQHQRLHIQPSQASQFAQLPSQSGKTVQFVQPRIQSIQASSFVQPPIQSSQASQLAQPPIQSSQASQLAQPPIQSSQASSCVQPPIQSSQASQSKLPPHIQTSQAAQSKLPLPIQPRYQTCAYQSHSIPTTTSAVAWNLPFLEFANRYAQLPTDVDIVRQVRLMVQQEMPELQAVPMPEEITQKIQQQQLLARQRKQRELQRQQHQAIWRQMQEANRQRALRQNSAKPHPVNMQASVALPVKDSTETIIGVPHMNCQSPEPPARVVKIKKEPTSSVEQQSQSTGAPDSTETIIGVPHMNCQSPEPPARVVKIKKEPTSSVEEQSQSTGAPAALSYSPVADACSMSDDGNSLQETEMPTVSTRSFETSYAASLLLSSELERTGTSADTESSTQASMVNKQRASGKIVKQRRKLKTRRSHGIL